jgi:diaminopimelate epimerase
MKFAKYQGIGNDFVMIADPDDAIRLTPEQVRGLCDRRFGIGGDGVIRVAPGSPETDFFMDYANSDGSVGEMCGNGIRCLAAFARDEGLTDAAMLRVDTRAGIKVIEVQDDERIRVDMGAPIFTPANVPVNWEGSDALHTKLELEHGILEAACLSMGNPHAVIFVEDLDGTPVTTLGRLIENHPAFPNGVNVEFVRITSPKSVDMRVWERGSGATLACGTGACAGAVAARLLRDTNRRVTVGLPGGDLDVSWEGSLDDEESVFMTGPATKSFQGEINI